MAAHFQTLPVTETVGALQEITCLGIMGRIIKQQLLFPE